MSATGCMFCLINFNSKRGEKAERMVRGWLFVAAIVGGRRGTDLSHARSDAFTVKRVVSFINK